MTDTQMAEPVGAAQALADILERENAALERLDMPAASALLVAKRAATEALLRTRAGLRTLTPARWQAARDALGRLDAEGARNRDLLARAIRVQGRVVALLASAAPPPRTTYGGANTRSSPIAVSLRA